MKELNNLNAFEDIKEEIFLASVGDYVIKRKHSEIQGRTAFRTGMDFNGKIFIEDAFFKPEILDIAKKHEKFDIEVRIPLFIDNKGKIGCTQIGFLLYKISSCKIKPNLMDFVIDKPTPTFSFIVKKTWNSKQEFTLVRTN